MAQLNFKGKAFVQNEHLGVKYHELVPKKDKSVTGKISLHDNLILHGDNLLALKALLPTYKELARYVFYTATGEELDELRIIFAQLPFEIYKLAG